MFCRNLIKLIMSIVGLSSLIQAFDDTSDVILRQAQSAIVDTLDEKIFLDPSRVSVQDEQLYIIDDLGNSIPISELYSESSGIYIKTGSRCSKPTILWICRNCTWSCSYQPNRCPNCLNETFDVLYQ